MRVALFSMILLLSCSSTQMVKDDDELTWTENRKLTWDDFKGRPEKRFSGASTHYTIIKELENKGSTAEMSVRAIFFTKKSWKRTMWINDEVLAHEQKHFDMVEWFSRKLRQAVLSETYPDYKTLKVRSDSMYDAYEAEMDKWQDQYDDESNGSMDGNGQRAWNKKIEDGLKELEKYKATDYTISLGN